MVENKILRAEVIISYISKYLRSGVNIIDALVEYCEVTGANIEDVAAVVKRNEMMFQQTKEVAISHNLIKDDEEENLNEFIK